MTITALYAPILALFFVLLSFRTLLLRRKHKIALGSGDNHTLARAARVHSNFAEYVPLALILIYLLEAAIESTLRIHILCVVLIAGRCLHAFGVSREPEDFRFRVAGMVMTLGVMISASLHLLLSAISQP